MLSLCRCARCDRVVRKDTGSILRKVVFCTLFLSTLPYAWLLFVAGPGVAGVLPIVIALGLSISAVFKDWAFPRPQCSHCRAWLEDQPDLPPAASARFDRAHDGTADPRARSALGNGRGAFPRQKTPSPQPLSLRERGSETSGF